MQSRGRSLHCGFELSYYTLLSVQSRGHSLHCGFELSCYTHMTPSMQARGRSSLWLWAELLHTSFCAVKGSLIALWLWAELLHTHDSFYAGQRSLITVALSWAITQFFLCSPGVAHCTVALVGHLHCTLLELHSKSTHAQKEKAKHE